MKSPKRHVCRTAVRVLAGCGKAALLQHFEYPLTRFRGVTHFEMNLTHVRPPERARRASDDGFGCTGRVDLDVVRAGQAVVLDEFINRQHDGGLPPFVRFGTLPAKTERAGRTELRDLEPGYRAPCADANKQAINPLLELV